MNKNNKSVKKHYSLALVLSTAMLSSQTYALGFHGYMRAGIGNNLDGGGQVCYGNGGANAHMVGRLGDECDLYAELKLAQEVYSQDDVSFKVHSNVAYGTEESGDIPQTSSQGNSWQGQGGDASSPWDGGRLSVREFYVSSKGLLGDSTVWIGKRFGQRKDIYIMDFFYLMNSGYGMGFDDLSAGPGKFSFNWIQSHTSSDVIPAFPDYDPAGGNNQNVVNGNTKSWERLNKIEARYSFGVGENNLELIGIYGSPSLTEDQKNGYRTLDELNQYRLDNGGANPPKAFSKGSLFLMAEYSMNIEGGFNKFVVSYGTNVFQNFRDGFWSLNNATWLGEGNGVGIINHGLVQLSDNIDLGYALMHTRINPDDDQGNGWFEAEASSLVVRPQFNWDALMSTIVEVGYDNINYENGAHQLRIGGDDLIKFTVAQAWSPLGSGGYWARPQIRLFVSHYGGDRAVSEAKTMFGGQVEAWW